MLDISSLTGRLNSPSQSGQTSRPEKEIKQSERVNPDVQETPETKGIPVSSNPETQVDFNSLGNNQVKYQVDQETQEVVIRVVDKESGEVIRQIPGEEFLRLTHRIAEFNQNILDASA